MQGESPTEASTPAGAVFLSYAFQDAEAAKRICEALRAGGIEVWFDQNELRGGDAWDHKIRDQIHDCRLFIPVISANTERRDEGYFRREWSLAVDRTRDMVHKRAFLVPVVIDATSERGAAVPEKFHELQWTRLPGGETSAAFVARVRRLLMPDASPAKTVAGPGLASDSISVPSMRRSSLYQAVAWGAGAVAAIACAYFIASNFWLSRRLNPASAPFAQQAAPGSGTATSFNPPPHSIAVLPFVNMSGDKEQEYFSDGITEELINALSHINSLQVIARTSSFSFKGKNGDIATIARSLNVAAILEGSMRRSGNKVRVTAQLINGVNGFHIWSENYDRDLKDALLLQTEIATSVAQQLQARLLGDEAAHIEIGGTHSPDAYDAYLRGMQNSYDVGNLTAHRAALADFDRAIAFDPDYSSAYAARAFQLININVTTKNAAEREPLRQLALAAAKRAVELAPGSAGGYHALWFVHVLGYFDFKSAAADIQRASSLAPGSAAVQSGLAEQASWLGHHEEAIRAQRRAVTLDPLDYSHRINLAILLLNARRFDEAIAAARDAHALNPKGIQIGPAVVTAYLGLGQPLLARQTCEERKLPFAEDDRHWCLSLAQHALGNLGAADRELASYRELGGDAGAYGYAEIYAQRGDVATALHWLITAERLRDPSLQSLKVDWLLDPLRAEPQFQALERRLGFLP